MSAGQTEGPEGRRALDPSDAAFHVALSYAADDAEYAVPFRERLESLGLRVFDGRREDSTVLWGAKRTQVIQEIFNKLDHVILFVSTNYVQESSVEWDTTVSNAVSRAHYALPVALDGTHLPGLSGDIGYLDARGQDGALVNPAELADIAFEFLTNPVRGRRWSSRDQASFGWDAFDPDRLHFVVVASEHENPLDEPNRLVEVVRGVLAGPHGEAVWAAARTVLDHQQTLRDVRALPAEYDYAAVRVASLSVTDVFRSDDTLDRAVRAIVQADVAVFDVTGFEPGVMLLLGVRGATRRGMTVTSHGGHWYEGVPLDRPFNLSDLSLASHAHSDHMAGDDPREARFARRFTTGFEQMRRQPHYHDLPVYDALRQLGPESGAWVPIPLSDEVLVLCTYAERYFNAWQALRNSIRQGLSKKQSRGTVIARLQDIATPQVVSQSLYEKIRRCVGCVVDWTYASPSTFFELGVRLATSPWGTVQIVDKTWWESLEPGTAPFQQLKDMQRTFAPAAYGVSRSSVGDLVADQLVSISTSGAMSGHRIRRSAVEALQVTQPMMSEVPEFLCTEADSLDNPVRERLNVPQTLFFEAKAIKASEERAALERRLAAWLYLEHRVRARELPSDEPRRRHWVQLGRQVAESLLSTGGDDDVDLGIMISELVESE